MKPIMKAVRDPQTASNDDWAKVLGTPKKKPPLYRHEDGSEYLHIQGAMAWPSRGPGCAVVMGVTKEDEPIYKIFEAAFSNHPHDLLRACIDLKAKYTPEEAPKLMQFWIGQNLFPRILTEVNNDQDFKLFLSDPPDIEEPNSDKILIEQLRTMSKSGKISIIPQDVSNELKAMTTTDAGLPLASFPAVAATAYALHYLSVHQPWLRRGGSPKNCDSI